MVSKSKLRWLEKRFSEVILKFLGNESCYYTAELYNTDHARGNTKSSCCSSIENGLQIIILVRDFKEYRTKRNRKSIEVYVSSSQLMQILCV